MSASSIPPIIERESFLAVQARWRRQAQFWLAAMTLVVFALTFVVGLLLAPLAFAVLGLLLDVLNLAVPTPDLLGAVGLRLAAWSDAPQTASAAAIAAATMVAALPGLAALLFAWRRLGRIAADRHVDALRGALRLRAPRSDDLEEIQLGNLVAEMAIAAGRAAPELLLLDSTACNLGVFGDGERAALLVTRGLLDRLDRAQTQALVGQAVAALGNGDGLLAERLFRLDLMIGFLSLLAQAPIDAAARAALRPLLRWRRSRNPQHELAVLGGVLGGTSSTQPQMPQPAADSSGWRDYAWMPLMGSLLIGILIVPVATLLLAAPLNSLIWRRRRLLADATAVQFTRDPQALAETYAALARESSDLGLGLAWLGDLFVLETKTASNLRIASPYPALAARIERLNAMGAAVSRPSQPRRPRWLLIVLWVLGAIVAGLMSVVIVLGAWLSLAINALFLALPTALLHALLRALGHA